MCGRYNLRMSPQKLAEVFDLVRSIEVEPQYNIAPTQPVVTIRSQPEGRVASQMQWGLIPSWAKDPKSGARQINARGETVAEKPSFRAAFKARRCLVPASGYFEWKTEGKTKQPFHVHRPDDQPIAFAGLWERWRGSADQPPMESCTIITTAAAPEIAWLHDRMPVILEPRDYDRWLTDNVDAAELLSLLRPYPEPLDVDAVSRFVSNSRNQGPECVARAE
jgi:putative SOS response-associated peptidase YedK